MSIKEARIVVPTQGNDMTAPESDKARSVVMEAACTMFGGFTCTHGLGGWLDPETKVRSIEPVQILDIAMEDNVDNDVKLHQLAGIVRDELKQKSVYVRYTNGNVFYID